jgi:hypothetical protein
MTRVVDIFVTLPDGSIKWIEAVEGLGNARERMKELHRLYPGRYFIFSEQNGMVQREEYPPIHSGRA